MVLLVVCGSVVLVHCALLDRQGRRSVVTNANATNQAAKDEAAKTLLSSSFVECRDGKMNQESSCSRARPASSTVQ